MAEPTSGADAALGAGGAGELEPASVAELAAAAAAAKLAQDVVILDVGELLGITDHFVLASARSDRQLGTVVDEVESRLRAHARRPRRREGTKDSGWVLLDYGDVVVHVFTTETREYYDLERLWADAPSTTVDDRPSGGASASTPGR